MAHRFKRGSSIPFSQQYFDTTGGNVYPSSVTCWVSYPTSGWPFRTSRASTYLALTQATSTSPFTGSWSSTAAWPGRVDYTIKASETTLEVVDGYFELEGSPSNVAST